MEQDEKELRTLAADVHEALTNACEMPPDFEVTFELERRLRAFAETVRTTAGAPIPMLLFCPMCGGVTSTRASSPRSATTRTPASTAVSSGGQPSTRPSACGSCRASRARRYVMVETTKRDVVEEKEPELLLSELQGSTSCSPDARCIAGALLMVAREIRALRKVASLEIANGLDNINDALSNIDIPQYEGAVQVEICRGREP